RRSSDLAEPSALFQPVPGLVERRYRILAPPLVEKPFGLLSLQRLGVFGADMKGLTVGFGSPVRGLRVCHGVKTTGIFCLISPGTTMPAQPLHWSEPGRQLARLACGEIAGGTRAVITQHAFALTSKTDDQNMSEVEQ